MPTNACDLMRRLIDLSGREIDDLRRRLALAMTKEEKAALGAEIDQAVSQLQVLEEEFDAECT